MTWQISSVPSRHLAEIAAIAMSGEGAQRLEMVLAILSDVLRRGATNELSILEATPVRPTCDERATGGESLRLAVIAHRIASDSANLIAIGTNAKGPCDPALTADLDAGFRSLFGALVSQLDNIGVKFIQATRPVDQPQLLLERLGFRPLAVLDYMVATARVAKASKIDATKIDARHQINLPPSRFLSMAQWGEEQGWDLSRSFAEFVGVVEATYVGSLDCPELAKLRTTNAVLQSYREAPNADLGLWMVVLQSESGLCSEEQVAGCLLLTPHHESGCIEITYMGITPQYRGLGYSDCVIEFAWGVAERMGLLQLSLGVDRENRYARTFYLRNGFEDFLSESVWGQKVAELCLDRRAASNALELPSQSVNET